jgi:hypothetical protein
VGRDLMLKPERLPTYPRVIEKTDTANEAYQAGPKFYRNIENSKIQQERDGVAKKGNDKNKLPVCVSYAEARYG